MMRLFWSLIAGLYSAALLAIIAMLNRIAACVARDFEAIKIAENVAMVFFYPDVGLLRCNLDSPLSDSQENQIRGTLRYAANLCPRDGV